MGSAGRIERVYFEIKQSHIDQWEKPQIKVTEWHHLQSSVLTSSKWKTTVKQHNTGAVFVGPEGVVLE